METDSNDTRLKVLRNGIMIGMIFMPEDELSFEILLHRRIMHLKPGEYTLIEDSGKEHYITLKDSLSFYADV